MANSNRGFASMSAEERSKISSKGGKASHGSNRASSSNTNSASKAAGPTTAAKRGGMNSHNR